VDLRSLIAERVRVVQERICRAAARAGRSPDEVLCVAVSKAFGPEAVRAAYEAGLRHFGENRVQEARTKIPLCPTGLTWHLVGTLQTNKASWAVRLFDWIHSVDRADLIDVLERACERYDRTLAVLVEVRLSPEPTKHGCSEAEVPALVERLADSARLRPVGLMTIPPYDPDPEASRPYFRRLRQLRDQVNANLAARGSSLRLHHLSMGMSHDFEVAIEEGRRSSGSAKRFSDRVQLPHPPRKAYPDVGSATALLSYGCRMQTPCAGFSKTGAWYRVPGPGYLAPGTWYRIRAEGRRPSTEDRPEGQVPENAHTGFASCILHTGSHPAR